MGGWSLRDGTTVARGMAGWMDGRLDSPTDKIVTVHMAFQPHIDKRRGVNGPMCNKRDVSIAD